MKNKLKNNSRNVVIRCEKCNDSDKCRMIDPYRCKNFSLSVDSNFKYVADPQLLFLEKNMQFVLCL
jgi:hypothetical protein